MLVLVTGGAGFLGSHSVREILRAGHRVRLLVRDRARAAAGLRAVGVRPSTVELVAGDVTDPEAVAVAVAGCTAVLHAAGVYSFDSRDRAAIRAVNERGTEVVLSAARAVGADPVVHVSTFGALLPAADAPVTTATPVGSTGDVYLATKAAAERVARRHQEAGAPVVITYPLASLGPYDIRLGDQVTRIRNALRGRMPVWPAGGFPVGDVRDVARLHAAVLRPGQGPRRFFAPGRYVSTREYVATLRAVTGRRLPTVFLPPRLMLPVGAAVGALQRVVPAHLPAEYGAIYLCAAAREVDNAATAALLDAPPRPLAATMADTVRWLYATGHLSRRAAGRCAAGRCTVRTEFVDDFSARD